MCCMTDKIGIRPATIIIDNGRVLLVKSKYQNEEFYLFPGGGLEFGETIEEGAIRETLEETGLKVKIKSLFHVNEYIYRSDWNKRSVSFFFIAEPIEGNILNPQTNDQGKITEVVWIPLEDLEKIDVKPKRIVKMISENRNLSTSNCPYSIDFKE